MRAAALGALALLLAPIPTLAQSNSDTARGTAGFQSAEALYKNCTGNSVHGREYCFAYVAAVADSVRAYQAWLNLNDVCLQRSISHGSLIDTYTGYFERNPSLGPRQAASVVVLSMQGRFPCGAAGAAPATTPVKPAKPTR